MLYVIVSMGYVRGTVANIMPWYASKNDICQGGKKMKKNLTKLIASAMAVATAFALVVTAVPDASAKKKKDAEEAPAAEEVDLDGTYHAYIGFQSEAYTFRNSWSGKDNYGFGTPEFEQVTGWEDNEEITVPAELHDVEITGNGTYTVSVTGLDLSNESMMRMLYVSTDIPKNDTIKFSDVQVKIDGYDKGSFEEGYMDDDEKQTHMTVLCINQYNDGLEEISYTMPEDSMEITFTVSGFNYDNEAPAGDETGDSSTDDASGTSDDTSTTGSTADSTSDNDEGSSFPVVPVVIAVVVVVVIVVVVAVKKKND